MLRSNWNKTVEQLKKTLKSDRTMWLDFATFRSADEDTVNISFESKMFLDSFSKFCKAEAQELLDELENRHVNINLYIDDSPAKEDENNKKEAVEEKKEEKKNGRKSGSLLNPSYSFDNFITCENTIFAFNAAKAIAMNPGINYNPCLIYGGVGLGKTHLLESIGNYIEEENPRKKVIYCTAETFTNDYINSLTDKNMSSFRIRYRKADVLLIDDIHFLQEKLQSQEELFHTFNDLYESHKQIVFTCDRPISELKGFTDRLKSRFTRGLNLNLTAPDYETRVAILRKKCEEKGVKIYDSVIQYMAENIKTNVRDLEGSLTTLIAYSNLIGKAVTLDVAQEQLKNIISAPMASEQDISISAIVKEVSSYFNIEISELKGKKRTAVIRDARNVAIFLSRKITQYSTTEIGTFFDRDHSTITHSIDKVDKERKTNAELAASLDSIENNIRNKAK